MSPSSARVNGQNKLKPWQRRFTLGEVVEGLQDSDFDDSDDEFDGYMDSDAEHKVDRGLQERMEGGNVRREHGTECGGICRGWWG